MYVPSHPVVTRSPLVKTAAPLLPAELSDGASGGRDRVGFLTVADVQGGGRSVPQPDHRARWGHHPDVPVFLTKVQAGRRWLAPRAGPVDILACVNAGDTFGTLPEDRYRRYCEAYGHDVMTWGS
ncbi:hypothetical protein QFZ49_003213 [Streptomyces turgidiscabies]|uniref:Uncharacterized protein n=1 Tax=Streptomyces turgidiscabies TaxID=85558 RepID=A0ABU0RNG9_9ACTN|nr:hypothetical protein [Streptomyces turgidiscabies]